MFLARFPAKHSGADEGRERKKRTGAEEGRRGVLGQREKETDDRGGRRGVLSKMLEQPVRYLPSPLPHCVLEDRRWAILSATDTTQGLTHSRL